MEEIARESAEWVRSLVRMRRAADASMVVAICDLAENYRVDSDELLEVLAERRVRVGGAGTPKVSEFVSLELAGLLGCTPVAAGHRIVEALNLKHRHPGLFDAVRALDVDADRALRAASRCGHLTPDAAEAVTRRWVPRQRRLGWSAAFTLLDRLIIESDPGAAIERERKAREDRGIYLWGFQDGCMNLTGRLDAIDARYLDAAVERLAEVLEGEHPGLTRDQRRAKAIGVLANPAYATALLQAASQQGLPMGDVVPAPVTVPLARLRPTLGVAVHIHCDALGDLTGSARLERAGHLTTHLLAEALAGVNVTVHPVIDLPNLEPEDGYLPGRQMRRAVRLAFDTEAFPFSNRSSAGLDLDHTAPYRPGVRGQTRIGNLSPLSRRVHRAKTAGSWQVEQSRAGILEWTSPLGYRYEVGRTGTRMLN